MVVQRTHPVAPCAAAEPLVSLAFCEQKCFHVLPWSCLWHPAVQTGSLRREEPEKQKRREDQWSVAIGRLTQGQNLSPERAGQKQPVASGSHKVDEGKALVALVLEVDRQVEEIVPAQPVPARGRGTGQRIDWSHQQLAPPAPLPARETHTSRRTECRAPVH